MSEQINLGSEIRSAREHAGYSLADIEKITRIPTFVLRDIEKNEFKSCGGATYARGNVRTLSKILNLNSNELIAKLEELTGEIDRPMIDLLAENNVTKPRSPKKAISYKTLGLVASVIVVLSILAPAVISFTKVHKVSTSSPTTSSTNTSSSDVNSNTAVATKTSSVNVVITGINGKSWVGIQDSSGAQVFSGRISQGEIKTFTDSQELFVTIGNAGAVSLNVNGRDLGSPGNVGEVVHLTFGPSNSNQG